MLRSIFSVPGNIDKYTFSGAGFCGVEQRSSYSCDRVFKLFLFFAVQFSNPHNFICTAVSREIKTICLSPFFYSGENRFFHSGGISRDIIKRNIFHFAAARSQRLLKLQPRFHLKIQGKAVDKSLLRFQFRGRDKQDTFYCGIPITPACAGVAGVVDIKSIAIVAGDGKYTAVAVEHYFYCVFDKFGSKVWWYFIEFALDNPSILQSRLVRGRAEGFSRNQQ